MSLFGTPPFHWSDTGNEAKRARNRLREAFRLGERRPKAPEDDYIRSAERWPEEFFKCSACGSGPWHITWGGICPNCSGAD